jgi:hypothetical protein
MRFKVGDVAILIKTRWHGCADPTGQEVVVRAMGPWSTGTEMLDGYCIKAPAEYEVETANGCIGHVMDWQLAPKRPPQELSTWEQVQKDTGWNPNKQKVTG